ncbi:MAG: acyltransferase [Candidatus Omnitrophica bacterium]|nr:acyltransferase [Candidatus Omnitrophota bacterium]
MNIKKFAQRFLIPQWLTSLIYFLKFRCFISHRAEVELSSNLMIGKNTFVSSFTKIKATDGTIEIGENTSIGVSSFISSGKKGLKIGDKCLISPNVSIVAGDYRYDRIDMPILEQEKTSKGIVIGGNVWIGAGAVILDGASVGAGSIITPNSVVSSTIPDNSIVQGNPAKVIFTRR